MAGTGAAGCGIFFGVDMETLYAVLVLAVLVIIIVAKTATVVPQQSAYVVESLGRYSRTIQAGFHILVPFIERIAYKHSLKEEAIDIPEQVTKDNVQVGVDGHSGGGNSNGRRFTPRR